MEWLDKLSARCVRHRENHAMAVEYLAPRCNELPESPMHLQRVEIEELVAMARRVSYVRALINGNDASEFYGSQIHDALEGMVTVPNEDRLREDGPNG